MHKAASRSNRSIPAALAVMLAMMLLLCGAGGCAFSKSRQATEKDAPIKAADVRVTGEQFRLRMRSLVGPMCGQIEQAADAIAATSDLTVKLAALKWKMEAVPAMREALFRPDPYAAAFDAAALCMQMVIYFEKGPGKELLGRAASAQAAAACRRILDDYMQVVASGTSSGDVAKAREFVQRWAAEHPIRHSIAGRETAMSRVYDQEFVGSRRALEYIADAAASGDDMSRKLDVYGDQLFRQAQWQMERLQLELVRDYHVDQAMPLAERAVKSAEAAVQTVDRLAPAVESTLAVAQDAPKLVASERETALKAVDGQITRVLQAVREERVTALEEIRKERIIASKDIRDGLLAQASQLAQEGERISKLEIDYVMEKSTRLVGIAMAIAIGVVLLVLLLRRRPLRAPTFRAHHARAGS